MAINFKRLEDITSALKVNNQSGRNFHVTFVYHGNRLLCIGQNNYNKIHPYHKFGKYEAKYGGNYVSGLHGECAAIIKLGLLNCSHLTFVNIRVCNNGKPAISKPCFNCKRLLDNVGYKSIWYFDGNQYIKMKN